MPDFAAIEGALIFIAGLKNIYKLSNTWTPTDAQDRASLVQALCIQCPLIAAVASSSCKNVFNH